MKYYAADKHEYLTQHIVYIYMYWLQVNQFCFLFILMLNI